MSTPASQHGRIIKSTLSTRIYTASSLLLPVSNDPAVRPYRNQHTADDPAVRPQPQSIL